MHPPWNVVVSMRLSCSHNRSSVSLTQNCFLGNPAQHWRPDEDESPEWLVWGVPCVGGSLGQWSGDLFKKKARKGVRRQWCRREATLCSLLPSSQGVEARLVNVQAPVPSETKRVPVKKVISFQMLTAECQTKSRALPSVRPLWLTGLTSLKPSVARETLLKRPRSPYLGRNACSGQKVGLSEFWQQVIFIEHLVWASPPTPPIILCVLTDLLLQGSSSYYLHFRGKEFGAQRS